MLVLNTPQPFRLIVEQGRPMDGERAKVNDPSFKGNAVKTNIEVNEIVKTGGIIGKGLVGVAVVNSVANIGASNEPAKQTVVESSGWAGAYYGGVAGAEAGAVLTKTPVGSLWG